MRVAILTPVLEMSAVGHVMASGAAQLRRRHDVELWSPAMTPRLRTSVPVRVFEEATPLVAEELGAFDLAVFAIGDSAWHIDILRLARAVPGLIVLHDISVANLVTALHVRDGRLPALRREVEWWYGSDVADQFEAAMSAGGRAWLDACARAPLVEQCLAGSLGVVVHSEWAAGLVEGMSLGDVTVAPLPVASAVAPTELPDVLADLPADAVLIVTLGHVNANRRIEVLLDAIADDPELRERAHLTVVGEHAEKVARALHEHADRRHLAGRLHLTGRIDDGALAAVLDRADVCAALRDPVLEAKSASLLTQMRAARPVLVLDHAHYAELPDQVVVKVPLPGSSEQISAALRGLVDDAGAAAAIGARAKEFVEAHHTPSAYADAMAAAAERALATRPVVTTAVALARRLDRAGLAGDELMRGLVANGIEELFPAP
jgi:glycosyltransferase involved in cell wall biosynthesis